MVASMTAADWIERIATVFETSSLHFGHGTDNARDEAAWLVLHVLDAPLDGSFDDWGRVVSESRGAEIDRLARARSSSGKPPSALSDAPPMIGSRASAIAEGMSVQKKDVLRRFGAFADRGADGLAHAVGAGEHGLDRPELDAVAAQLDLVVDAAVVEEPARAVA